MTYTISLPWAIRLTANESLHWRAKAKKVAHIRQFVGLLVKPVDGPVTHAEVWLNVYPPDRRRRDADNFFPTLKAACDAICYALPSLPDDTPQYMTKHMPVICEPDSVRPRMELVYEVNGG